MISFDRRLASADPTVPDSATWGYRTRTLTLKLTVNLSLFLTLTWTLFERKQKRHRNIGQYNSYIYRLFTKGRGWVYHKPISRNRSFSILDLRPQESFTDDYVTDYDVACFYSVNNRTVVQLPLAASHPPLGCRAFIMCTNLRYAFSVTMHL